MCEHHWQAPVCDVRSLDQTHTPVPSADAGPWNTLCQVLSDGDRIKVMVLSQDKERGRLALCTKKLEPTPGEARGRGGGKGVRIGPGSRKR